MIPALVGQMAWRASVPSRALAGGNLEHVAVVVVVVPNHVQHKGAHNAHRGRVPGAAVFPRSAQTLFHQRLAQGSRPQAIAREFLAGQVH